MKKIIFVALLFVVGGCSSTKMINGKPQTFTEYVLLNKNAERIKTDNGFADFKSVSEDAFPVNRIIKWNNAE